MKMADYIEMGFQSGRSDEISSQGHRHTKFTLSFLSGRRVIAPLSSSDQTLAVLFIFWFPALTSQMKIKGRSNKNEKITQKSNKTASSSRPPYSKNIHHHSHIASRPHTSNTQAHPGPSRTR